MFKRIATIITVLVLGLFVTAASAHAAVSVRLQQPKSPNNTNSFNITFVTLDTESNPVTVKCFKKGPSDGAFSQFGSDIVVSSGGNTENCVVNNSIITGDGTYQFQAIANNNNGSGDVVSNTVSVEVKTSNPGTPINYSKEKINACEYKIHFRTADDGGKTVKVEVYRSENKTFNADAATRQAEIAIGSNTDHDFTQSVPDCNKTYYYVVRAFDSAGNGSGLTGDSETVETINTINPTTTTQQGGAIPVGSGANSQSGVQGTGTGEGSEVSPTGEEGKSDIDTASVDEEKGVQGVSTQAGSWFSTKKAIGLAVVVIVVILGYWFLRRRFSK